MIKHIFRKYKVLASLCLVSGFCLLYSTSAHATDDVPIDEDRFPDPFLRNYVAENLDTDHNGLLNSDEIYAVTELEFNGTYNHMEHIPDEITSAKGLEVFTNLRSLALTHTNITELDISMYKELTDLDVSYNHLTSLDVSNNLALVSLVCVRNELTSIDISKNSALVTFLCAGNPLEQIDVSHNTALEELAVTSPTITTLDISHNPALKLLEIGGKNITSIDLSKCPELEKLHYAATSIVSINISHNPKLLKILSEGKIILGDSGVELLYNLPNGEYYYIQCKKDYQIVEVPFNDVYANAWSYEAIRYAYNNGYMIGVGDEVFAPGGIVTRAQFVQLLYNIEGKPSFTPTDQFVDVLPGQWYTDAIMWAANNQITAGINENEFGTNLPITREQMITLFYNYGKTKENYRKNIERKYKNGKIK